MQDKDSIRSCINKRMNVVHRCIRTPNIVLIALSTTEIESQVYTRGNESISISHLNQVGYSKMWDMFHTDSYYT